LYSAHLLRVFEPNRVNNRLMKYNWQKEDWTKFIYQEDLLDNILLDFAEKDVFIPFGGGPSVRYEL